MREECPKEEYPEGLYRNITIRINLESDGYYFIVCPEWRFEVHRKNPDHVVTVVKELVSEIMEHNKNESSCQ